MGLDELREQQRKRAEWETFGEHLSQELKASLPILERGLLDKTGLKLGFGHDSFWITPNNGGSGSGISGGTLIRVCVSGVSSEVVIEVISCSITRQPNGFRYLFSLPPEEEDQPWHSIEIDRPLPSVPLRLRYNYEWTHNLWWTGSADTPKLENAILDGLEKKERRSEFSIERPRPQQSGCASAAVSLMLAALALLAAASWAG